jgi:hypothetical protein
LLAYGWLRLGWLVAGCSRSAARLAGLAGRLCESCRFFLAGQLAINP